MFPEFILRTCHKEKGLEEDFVQIANDFACMVRRPC